MNRSCILILLLFIVTPVSLAIGQKNNVVGLWGVEMVMVGERDVTPVAKWFRINQDGTNQAGNGWLQNSEGTWKYDEQNHTYESINKNGIADEFGPFSIHFEEEKMVWQRDEEGMDVTVTLSRIDELPKAPADLVQGLWDLEQVFEKESDITEDFDAADLYYIFIRWDRIYVERTVEGERTSGFWHMDAHQPHITLISHQDEKKREAWNVDVSDSTLVLTGLSDSNKNLEMHLVRIQAFPE